MSFEILKHKNQINSDAWEKYLRSEFCPIDRTWPSTVAHDIPRGRAAGSILLAVPLSFRRHQEQTKGKWQHDLRGYLASHGVELDELRFKLRFNFLRTHDCASFQIAKDAEAFEAWMLENGFAERNDKSKRWNRKPYLKGMKL